MHPTPRMPVEEHRCRLANALFQITNGFGQVMRGVADVAAPLASIGPVGIGLVSAEAVDDTLTEAVDPRRDTRPEADSIFNPAFVDVPDDLKRNARCHRRTLPVMDVIAAWSRCEWGTWPTCRPSARRRCRPARPIHGSAPAPGHGAGRVSRGRELRVPGVRVPRGGSSASRRRPWSPLGHRPARRRHPHGRHDMSGSRCSDVSVMAGLPLRGPRARGGAGSAAGAGVPRWRGGRR